MPRESRPFGSTAALAGLGTAALARVAGLAGDIALVLTPGGSIIDVAWGTKDPVGRGREGWIGADWADTATIESRAKVAEMLAEARGPAVPRWRQINHQTASGDVPVRYLVVGEDGSDRMLAIGVDMSAMSALQQRLIQTQQSLERDYLKLRQTEARYRLLFDLDGDAVLVVDADGRRIREANPAAHRLVRAKPGALVNRGIAGLFAASSQDDVVALIGSAVARADVAPISAVLSNTASATVQATAFRQDRAAYVLLRVTADAPHASIGGTTKHTDALDLLPDAVVLTDAQLAVTYANTAFLDLVQEVSAARVTGVPLGTWLGRAGIDLDLMVEQVRQHGNARNVATIVRIGPEASDEVEASAVATTDDGFAFSIRAVGRRVRDLPPAPQDLPRSVEQLTELVGRMSLKDIVRESTDLIERLCIEAALEYTSDNRASAAEILGLSRQSLYSKLHRHGLGNLADEDE